LIINLLPLFFLVIFVTPPIGGSFVAPFLKFPFGATARGGCFFFYKGLLEFLADYRWRQFVEL
jgi:hypothetical protein